jgi:parallel beta-helix repeat protein
MNPKPIMLLLLSFLITTQISTPLTPIPERNGQTRQSQFYSVHNLNTSLNYTTIQEAINDTKTLNGHTIFVEAGTYNENVALNKEISLIGENRNNTIIEGTGTGTVVDITANNASLSDFTIRNSGNTVLDAGVKLSNVKNCTVSSNILDDNWNGLMLSYASNNTVLENSVKNSNDSGIAVWNSNDNTVKRNNVKNNKGYGIYLQNSTRCRITDNTVVGSTDDEIAILNSHANLIQRNTVVNGQANGIRLDDPSNNNFITENTIANNTEYGFWLWYSNNNSFIHNFCNNAKTVLILTVPPNYNAVNIWDDGYPSGGNYWSNYTGSDTHSGPYENETGSDGIGDTPYTIDQNNTDNYPLMGKFSTFNATPEYQVDIVSNSTIEELNYFPVNNTIRIRVSNTSTSSGFCQIRIPKALIPPPNNITIDNGITKVLHFNNALYDNGVDRWVYFAYLHSAHEIVVIPEFPSLLLTFLSIIAALAASTTHKKKPRSRHNHSHVKV